MTYRQVLAKMDRKAHTLFQLTLLAYNGIMADCLLPD